MNEAKLIKIEIEKMRFRYNNNKNKKAYTFYFIYYILYTMTTTWKARTQEERPERPEQEKIYDVTEPTVVRSVSTSKLERQKLNNETRIAALEEQNLVIDADLAKIVELEA